MKIYYSGTCSNGALPEFCIREKKPHVMMTFFDFHTGNSGTLTRWRAHRNRVTNQSTKPASKSK